MKNHEHSAGLHWQNRQGDSYCRMMRPIILVGVLLRTLHHDIILHLRHPDGIESYQLHDGIGNTLVFDALGHPEILQLIIHEVDGVLMLAGVQILQRRRERHIIILSGDALGIRLLNPKQQKKEEAL